LLKEAGLITHKMSDLGPILLSTKINSIWRAGISTSGG